MHVCTDVRIPVVERSGGHTPPDLHLLCKLVDPVVQLGPDRPDHVCLVDNDPVEVLVLEPCGVLQNGLVRGNDDVGSHRIQNETFPPLEDVELEVAHMAEGVAPVEQSALWCKHNGPHGVRRDD